jgi:hypothetical protein
MCTDDMRDSSGEAPERPSSELLESGCPAGSAAFDPRAGDAGHPDNEVVR